MNNEAWEWQFHYFHLKQWEDDAESRFNWASKHQICHLLNKNYFRNQWSSWISIQQLMHLILWMKIFTLLARLWRRSWWTEHLAFASTLNYIKSHHCYLKVVFLFMTSYITESFAYIQILTFTKLSLRTIQTCLCHTLLILNSCFSHTTSMIQRSRICIKMNKWSFLNLSSDQSQLILSQFCLRIMKIHQFFRYKEHTQKSLRFVRKSHS